MNSKTTALAALAFLGLCITSTLRADDSTPPPATPPAAPAKQITVEPPADAKLVLARNGVDVVVSWTLPPSTYRTIDIMRHTQPEPKGRGRIGTVGPSKPSFLDTLPDKTVTYWYWIKVTNADRSAFYLGPVICKPAEIWTP